MFKWYTYFSLVNQTTSLHFSNHVLHHFQLVSHVIYIHVELLHVFHEELHSLDHDYNVVFEGKEPFGNGSAKFPCGTCARSAL